VKRAAFLLSVLCSCMGTVEPEGKEPPGSTQLAACFDGTARVAATAPPRIRRLSRYELENTFEALRAGAGARVHTQTCCAPRSCTSTPCGA
jgi:hypothetical protein